MMRVLELPTPPALTLMLLGLSCACGGGGSAAETFQPEVREEDNGRLQVFGVLDQDGDGALSASEIDAAAELLAALDADGDGQLSDGELRPRPRVFVGGPADLPEGTNIITLDARDGGSLDISELPPQARGLLSSAADADGDGAVSASELLAMMAAQASEQSGRSVPGSSGGVPASLTAVLDADQDGTVSAPEIELAPQSLRTLDSDGDGRLSPAELRPDSGGATRPE